MTPTKNKRNKILGNVWVDFALLLGSVALFFTICIYLKGILISLFLAFIVAYILDPVVDFIETRKKIFPKIRIQRSFAICILMFFGTLTTVGLFTYAIPKTVIGIQQVGNTLKLRFPKFRSNVKDLIEKYGNEEISLFLKDKLGIGKDNNAKSLPEDGSGVNWGMADVIDDQKQGNTVIGKESRKVEIADESDKKNLLTSFVKLKTTLIDLKKYGPQVLKFTSNITKTIFESTFGIFGILIDFFIFGVVMIYLLKDFDKITAKVRQLIPSSNRDKITEIFSKIDVNLKEFFRGQITVCLILSFIYSIGLTVVGVPLSFVLGFIAGFGNVIPYVGTIAGLGLTIAITFFHFHDVQHLVFVSLVFGIGQLLEGTLITPKIIGGKLGLSPIVIIVSILIWSELLGFLGLLLAVPFTSAIKVLIDEGILKYKNSSIYKEMPK